MIKIHLLLFLILFSTTVRAQNLVYRTHFDNGQAQDISGNGHHGTLFGNPVSAAGYSGAPNTALRFDGLDDKVALPAHAHFNLTKWTLQALVKVDEFYTGQCQVSSIIYHGFLWQSQHYSLRTCDNWYDNDCSSNTNMEAFDAQPAGSSSMNFHSSYYTTNGFAQTGQWYCLTATYDGDTVKLYVDGDLIVSGAWADQYSYPATTPEICWLGWSPHPGFPYWFNGIMDEISIWDNVINFGPSEPDLCSTYDTVAPAKVNSIVANDNNVRIYPSPATTEINVDLSASWAGASVYILNGVGQVVAAKNAESKNISIDIQHLPSGVYMVKAVKGGQTIVERFVKQ